MPESVREGELGEIFGNSGIVAFGKALGYALYDKDNQDYASLTDVEFANDPEQFAQAIERFLRRYHSASMKREKKNKPVFMPTEEDLSNLMAAVGKYGVRAVKSAVVSYALVKRKGSD